MKKLVLTIAIVLGMTIGATAQEKGLFGLGRSRGDIEYNGLRDPNDPNPLVLPNVHGDPGDAPAPLGSGIAVLIGLGAAYAMSKRRKE